MPDAATPEPTQTQGKPPRQAPRQAPRQTDKGTARRLAMQILYVWDANKGADDRLAERVTEPTPDEPHTHAVRRRALEVARAAWQDRRELEQRINRISPQWPVRRQAAVDRCVILLGAWEILHGEAPPKVALSACIDLAKTYGGADSGPFVNAVLDKVLKQREEQHAGLTEL